MDLQRNEMVLDMQIRDKGQKTVVIRPLGLNSRLKSWFTS